MAGFLNPEEILNRLELKDDMSAADFGCGAGGWAIPLAKKLSDGTVFAIDILAEPLSALKGKALAERVLNTKTIRADVEAKDGLKMLNNDSLDLVLITNLLFQVEDRKRVLGEAKRILKSGGKILIIDWQKASGLGPKENRVPVEEVKDISRKLGLKEIEEFAAGNYHYGLILLK